MKKIKGSSVNNSIAWPKTEKRPPASVRGTPSNGAKKYEREDAINAGLDALLKRGA